MTVEHVPARTIIIEKGERWLCEGHMHAHRTRDAAERCELLPRVYASGGRARVRREDGSMVLGSRYGENRL